MPEKVNWSECRKTAAQAATVWRALASARGVFDMVIEAEDRLAGLGKAIAARTAAAQAAQKVADEARERAEIAVAEADARIAEANERAEQRLAEHREEARRLDVEATRLRAEVEAEAKRLAAELDQVRESHFEALRDLALREDEVRDAIKEAEAERARLLNLLKGDE